MLKSYNKPALVDCVPLSMRSPPSTGIISPVLTKGQIGWLQLGYTRLSSQTFGRVIRDAPIKFASKQLFSVLNEHIVRHFAFVEALLLTF